MKTKIKVIVEKATTGNYACYPEKESEDIGLAGYGDTAAEAIEDFKVAYEELCEFNAKKGIATKELEFEFKYDMQSFFDYFNFLNVSKVAERAGINSAQLRQYLIGKRKASQVQYDKMSKCIEEIKNELEVATF